LGSEHNGAAKKIIKNENKYDTEDAPVTTQEKHQICSVDKQHRGMTAH
jgi:hypothetical protein